MAMFASTLYPQTNPTNPVLLAYRDHIDTTEHLTVEPVSPSGWVRVMDSTYRRGTHPWARAHVDHALKVLTRLESFSG